MHSFVTLPESLAAAFATLAFGCIAHGRAAVAGQGAALDGASYVACGKSGDHPSARGTDDRFACAGYGSANRCATSGKSVYDGYDGRGAANMQAGCPAARSLNPVLPYSTDDSDPNLLYIPSSRPPSRL